MDSGDTFALRTNNAGNGNLLNPAGLDDGGPAERYASMSITRNPAGASLRTEKRYTEELRNPLDTRDIHGTRANLRFNHVRDTFHETGDISGAAPKPRHLSRSGHVDVLELDDIPGTRARKTDLQTRRCTNPLDPAYKLPSAAEVVPVPAPFKRELQLRLDDIEGTRPATYLPWKPRERTMDVTVRAATVRSSALPQRAPTRTLAFPAVVAASAMLTTASPLPIALLPLAPRPSPRLRRCRTSRARGPSLWCGRPPATPTPWPCATSPTRGATAASAARE